jgi:hypothetical protein
MDEIILHRNENRHQFTIDDRVKNIPSITKHQENLIIGSLLGDGWISKNRKHSNSNFGKRQKKEQHIKWLFEELKPYGSSCKARVTDQKRIRLATGKVISEKVQKYIVGYETRTINHPYFTQLRLKWYPNDIKKVPMDLVLNPEILAIWYVDDGTNSKGYRQCAIATDGFSFNEVEFLCNRLSIDLNICGKPNKHVGKHNIVFHGDGYERLINLIKPYVIWDDFAYKLEYKPLKRRKNLTISEKEEVYCLLDQNVNYEEISKRYNIKLNTVYTMKKLLNKRNKEFDYVER